MKRLIKNIMKDIIDKINPRVSHVVILSNYIETAVSINCNHHKEKIIEMLEKTLLHLKTNGKEGFKREKENAYI